MSGFQRNLAKVMNQNSYNFELAKSIMDLQYLTISGNPYALSSPAILNKAAPSQNLPLTTPVQKPEDRFTVFNNQINLNFKSQSFSNSYQLEQQPAPIQQQIPKEQFYQQQPQMPLQSLKIESQSTKSYEYPEDSFLVQKPRQGIYQQSQALNSFQMDDIFNSNGLDVSLRHQDHFETYGKVNQLPQSSFLKLEEVPIAHDMFGYEADKVWESRERKLSGDSHLGGMLSDIFLYQNFPKENNECGFLQRETRDEDDFLA